MRRRRSSIGSWGRWAEESRKANARTTAGRLRLIAELGGKCALCGESRPGRLQIDHTDGRDWEPNRVKSWTRLARYRREAKEGKLQVLCETCNARKSKADKLRVVARRRRAEARAYAAAATDDDEVPGWVTAGDLEEGVGDEAGSAG